MFKAPFSFNGRIRRQEYGISIIVYAVVINLTDYLSVNLDNKVLIFLSQMTLLPLFWFMIAQGTKRCHDRNNPGYFQLFLPIYIFWMLLAPGDRNQNKYGKNPKIDPTNMDDILDSTDGL